MRFLSGRASCGARAMLRALFGGAFVVLGLIAGGCGSTTYTYGTPVISFSTVPGPFSSYTVQVDQIYFTRDDGTIVYPLVTPEIVDFARYRDFTHLFGTPAVIEGNYVSATITLDYSAAQIFPNGAQTAISASNIIDGNLTASSGKTTVAGVITYTVKFDPNHKLVIKNGVSTPIDFNFDLTASSVLDTSSGTPVLTVRPVLTASTEPVYTKPLHLRGAFVVGDVANSNFTINSHPFYDLTSLFVGAVAVQTDANTVFNIDGKIYTGAAGLALINALAINTNVEAYGQLGSLDAVKPSFVATQVYAGISTENYGTSRVTGTVWKRTGNTLYIALAHFVTYDPNCSSTYVDVSLWPNLSVTLGSGTLVTVDGQTTAGSTQSISVGQQVEVEGAVNATVNGCVYTVNSLDASAGTVRLLSTPAWGTLGTTGTQPTSGTVNLVSVGDYQPGALFFTGTGSPTGADSNPTAYVISNSSGTDLTTLHGQLLQFNGVVAPFGSAPPDFLASGVVQSASADQLLVIDWVNGGSTAPFTVSSTGISVNMSDANLGTQHYVFSGPVDIPTTANTVDLTNPAVTPQIVPSTDTTKTLQLVVGNSSSTEYAVFHDYASFVTQLGTVLNGTNKIQKLVAVGTWNGPTFTAYRIDIVQLP